jgi:CheY-like chemotaxis protein
MNEAANLSAASPAHAPQRCWTIARPRILVVDDDEDIRLLNASILEESGYKVATAEDGAVAWAALGAECYDLLITDHNMPKLSGIELLNQLHAARKLLPAILVSGAIPHRELRHHPWLRISAMLLKPYTMAELLGTVARVLRARDVAWGPGITGTVSQP